MEKKPELGPGIWGETISISFWNGEYNRILLTKLLKCKCKIDFFKKQQSIQAVNKGNDFSVFLYGLSSHSLTVANNMRTEASGPRWTTSQIPNLQNTLHIQSDATKAHLDFPHD